MKLFLHFFTSLLLLAFTVAPVEAQKKADKTTVQKKKQATTNKIKQNSKKLEQNKAQTAKQLRELSFIQEEIKSLNAKLAKGKQTLDSLDRSIGNLNDTILDCTNRLDNLSRKYADALRHQHGTFRSISPIAYIFSSANVSQALRKYRALKNFAKWRARKVDEIDNLRNRLLEHQQALTALQNNQKTLVGELEHQQDELIKSEKRNQELITSLNKKGNEIKSIIDNDRKELQELNAQLEKLIAEEQKRIAEEKRKEEERIKAEEQKARELEEQKRLEEERLLAQQNEKTKKQKNGKGSDKKENNKKKAKDTPEQGKLVENKTTPPVQVKDESKGQLTSWNTNQITAGFASSKGKLPFPVDGRHIVVRGFGRQKHPDLPMIETDNPGIDISVEKGALARNVYEGIVSAIFKQPGYNNVVMVRHGDYITIYANLDNVMVTKGEKIGAGCPIGKISVDEDDAKGRSIIHFEIRREKEKENPLLWLLNR